MKRRARSPAGSKSAGVSRAASGARKIGRPPKHYRPPYDIESVTAAAVRVFNRCGYEAASMEDVARETGITKSSLYYYVSGKEELLSRALERAFKGLLGVLDEPGAQSGTPLERLRHIVYRGVIITLAFVQEVELLQRVKGNTPTEREAMTRRRRFDSEVAKIVREAIAAGQIDASIDARLLTRLIFGLGNSLTQWYRPEGRLRPEQIAEAVSHLIFSGIARRD